ncbi:hypothetical protein KUTeg_016850 [Tegillarca granosa]|uniref:Uncharacterized protein n=1 Tax=Tegillarca granosa TaxID=220873 RepID=A0ABQ9EMA7_TEGGR|nr:hypothetical protein KUTeg_016850 [Tegillarca granosa]
MSKSKFEQLYTKMTTNNQYISSGTVDSWFKSFTDYLSASGTPYPNDESSFISLLHSFVTTQSEGVRHRREISFINNSDNSFSTRYLVLEEFIVISGSLTATFISFTHVNIDGTTKQIESMDETQKMIKGIFTEGECFTYARRYQTYETNKESWHCSSMCVRCNSDTDRPFMDKSNGFHMCHSNTGECILY